MTATQSARVDERPATDRPLGGSGRAAIGLLVAGAFGVLVWLIVPTRPAATSSHAVVASAPREAQAAGLSTDHADRSRCPITETRTSQSGPWWRAGLLI